MRSGFASQGRGGAARRRLQPDKSLALRPLPVEPVKAPLRPPKPGGAFIQHATELGANAAVGMRYDATEIMQGVTEVLAYGTAVYVEKKSQYIRAAGLKNCLDGEPGRNRTCDPRIKSALLYQLSYGPTLLI